MSMTVALGDLFSDKYTLDYITLSIRVANNRPSKKLMLRFIIKYKHCIAKLRTMMKYICIDDIEMDYYTRDAILEGGVEVMFALYQPIDTKRIVYSVSCFGEPSYRNHVSPINHC